MLSVITVQASIECLHQVYENGAYYLTGLQAPSRLGYGTVFSAPYIPAITSYIYERQQQCTTPKRIRLIQLNWKHSESTRLGYSKDELYDLRPFFKQTPVSCEESQAEHADTITTTHHPYYESPRDPNHHYMEDEGADAGVFHGAYLLQYDMEAVPPNEQARLPVFRKPDEVTLMLITCVPMQISNCKVHPTIHLYFRSLNGSRRLSAL
jgi:hypothetical protein